MTKQMNALFCLPSHPITFIKQRWTQMVVSYYHIETLISFFFFFLLFFSFLIRLLRLHNIREFVKRKLHFISFFVLSFGTPFEWIRRRKKKHCYLARCMCWTNEEYNEEAAEKCAAHTPNWNETRYAFNVCMCSARLGRVSVWTTEQCAVAVAAAIAKSNRKHFSRLLLLHEHQHQHHLIPTV